MTFTQIWVSSSLHRQWYSPKIRFQEKVLSTTFNPLFDPYLCPYHFWQAYIIFSYFYLNYGLYWLRLLFFYWVWSYQYCYCKNKGLISAFYAYWPFIFMLTLFPLYCPFVRCFSCFTFFCSQSSFSCFPYCIFCPTYPFFPLLKLTLPQLNFPAFCIPAQNSVQSLSFISITKCHTTITPQVRTVK